MALFNITASRVVPGLVLYDFRVSNMNITIDTEQLRISELQITYEEWLNNI